jgi:BirA family biotin operon repressor/biotin-[acetyl-CoA-carboxylase] ligase
VALALVHTLREYGIECRIKWTNDIYVGDKKLAGILIEHKLQGSGIARTIAGIGLNVNQTEFSAQLPNPVSMAQVAGREFDRDEVLERLNESLVRRYEQLRGGDGETLQKDYHRSLYRLDSQYYYALPDGTRFRGTIRGVAESGALAIEHEQGELHHYLFKEVEFVIAQG